MSEDIEIAIVDALKKLGYENVEGNCGTVWYDYEGSTYSITSILCE